MVLKMMAPACESVASSSSVINASDGACRWRCRVGICGRRGCGWLPTGATIYMSARPYLAQ